MQRFSKKASAASPDSPEPTAMLEIALPMLLTLLFYHNFVIGTSVLIAFVKIFARIFPNLTVSMLRKRFLQIFLIFRRIVIKGFLYRKRLFTSIHVGNRCRFYIHSLDCIIIKNRLPVVRFFTPCFDWSGDL